MDEAKDAKDAKGGGTVGGLDRNRPGPKATIELEELVLAWIAMVPDQEVRTHALRHWQRLGACLATVPPDEMEAGTAELFDEVR